MSMAVRDAVLQRKFVLFCESSNSTQKMQRLRTVLAHTPNVHATMKCLMKDESLSDRELEILYKWVKAFLAKSPYRKKTSLATKFKLLKAQDWKCPYCGTEIDEHSAADHIVPFKYVGDELGDANLQMTCVNCNSVKNARTDFALTAMIDSKAKEVREVLK